MNNHISSNTNKDIALFSFEDRAAQILDKMIIPGSNEEPNYKRNVEKILSTYYDFFKTHKKVPDIDDIACYVNEYNGDIIQEIASMDFSENYYTGYMSNEEIEYHVVRLNNEWWDNYGLYPSTEMDEYIMWILDDNKYLYRYSDNHVSYSYYTRPYDDVVIYKNNCQNILVPIFKERMYAHFAQDLYIEDIMATDVVDKE